jgi:hypothetical protein
MCVARMMAVHLVRCLAVMMALHLVRCLAVMMAVRLARCLLRCLAHMMDVYCCGSDDGCALGVLLAKGLLPQG